MGVCKDTNSGNPLGMGMGSSTMYQGRRTTARAYLVDAPSNLTIVVNSPIAKVLFEGTTATGVVTIDGRTFRAKHEVLLASGALNTAQLLLLSGVGPAEQLHKQQIPVIKDLPYVGKNLQDHCMTTATLIQKPGTNDRMAFESDPKAMEAAKAQYAKDRTGPLNHLYIAQPMGWFKSDAVYASKEFRALKPRLQAHLQKPTIPIFEIATVMDPSPYH